MKRIAYYPLHYGREYLAHSIRSIQDAVDEIHILYTDVPSFGHNSGAACPESEAALAGQAHRFLTKPLFWHKGRWSRENEHRDTIRGIASDRGCYLVLAVDADEIWDPATASALLDAADQHNAAGSIGAKFVHFWRSLDWVCHDPCMPIRVIDLRHPWQTAWYGALQAEPVLHFGYAQSEALIRYKWTCHGHQRELRGDWLGRFASWQPGQGDVHPTNANFWNPVPVDDHLKGLVRSLLHDHPYYGKGIIR